jgi:hypothetical protein
MLLGLVSPPPKCASCGKRRAPMFRCARCQVAPYCSMSCQRAEWAVHQKECRECVDDPANAVNLDISHRMTDAVNRLAPNLLAAIVDGVDPGMRFTIRYHGDDAAVTDSQLFARVERAVRCALTAKNHKEGRTVATMQADSYIHAEFVPQPDPCPNKCVDVTSWVGGRGSAVTGRMGLGGGPRV